MIPGVRKAPQAVWESSGDLVAGLTNTGLRILRILSNVATAHFKLTREDWLLAVLCCGMQSRDMLRYSLGPRNPRRTRNKLPREFRVPP
jgi:hypothetical protein